MKPIKVLHVVDLEVENYYLNNLVDFTNKDLVEFSFVNFGKNECGFADGIKKRNCKIYSIERQSRKDFPQLIKEVSKILKTENPDIVHTHLFYPSVIGLSVAKFQKRKTVLTRHHSDALHLLPSKLKRSFYLTLENYISKNSDHIIAPSRAVRECLVEWENVSNEKISIIPYGQTIERFESITDENIAAKRNELGMNNQLSLVCVSRLFNRKGHIYLFEALAPLIKNGLRTKLYLVGAGDYKEKLEDIAKKLEISQNIEFLGWRNDGLEIIAAADIIVHPSLEDALSSSLIESLMLAKPIIATDISGAADTLDSGRYGKLIPPADAESFRQALEETIENLEEVRENARLGKQYLLEYMGAKRVADEYKKVYQRVLMEK